MGEIDAVYFVRRFSKSPTTGHQSEELRYSLRSLHGNFGELGRVFVLGGRPDWLNRRTVHWRPGGEIFDRVDIGLLERWHDVKHLQTWSQWQAIARAAVDELSDRFVIMNDDFFVMHKVGEIPNQHRGSVKAWAEARRFGGDDASADVIERTANLVADRYGVDVADQVAYETHSPLTVNGHAFAAVMRDAQSHYLTGGARLAKRSLVANAARLPAELCQRDWKVFGAHDRDDWAAKPFLSTTEDSFRHGTGPGEVGRYIRRAFRDPSPYEIC